MLITSRGLTMNLTKSLWTKLITIGLSAAMALGVGLTASKVIDEVSAATSVVKFGSGATNNWTTNYQNLGSDYIGIATTSHYAQVTSTNLFGSDLVLSSDLNVTFKLGTYGGTGQQGTFAVALLNSGGSVLSVGTGLTNLTGSSESYAQGPTNGITVTKPANPSDIASVKVYLSNVGSITTSKYVRLQELTLTYTTAAAIVELSSIAVTSQPSKKDYFNGDYFDPTDMVVTATYSNSSTANVTSSCTYSPSPLTTGTTSVTVSYSEGGITKTTSVTGISVTIPKTLNSISVSGSPTKSLYYAGESFDPTGITVTAHYADSTTANVTDLCTYSPDPLTAGTTSVTVSYTEVTTKTTSVSGLTVLTKTLQSISINSMPSNTTFSLGSNFSSAGLSINAVYNGGTEVVSAGLSVTGVNTMVLGSQTATVSYGGETTSYSVNVTNQGASLGELYSDLIISEYIEGSGNDKVIEIFNGTGSSVSLSNYTLKINANANTTWSNAISLGTSLLANGNTFVISHSSANASILAIADMTSGSITPNGDDAIGLFKSDVLLDIFGVFGEDPGTGWEVGGVSNATVDNTITRNSNVNTPTTTWNTSEWTVQSGLPISFLGSHTAQLGDVTYSEQATAFANYVMTGIGNNAAGNCAAVKSELDAEYGYMVAESKSIFDTSADDLFVNARARMNYLANWLSAQGQGSGEAPITNAATTRSALLTATIIGIVGLSAIAGFYFLHKKKETA